MSASCHESVAAWLQASSEDGLVTCYDARNGSKSAPLYRLSAHDRPACALSFSTAVPGLLATASTDKQVVLLQHLPMLVRACS